MVSFADNTSYAVVLHITYKCDVNDICGIQELTRNARAHCVNVVGHLYKRLSIMPSRKPLQALSVNIAAKIQTGSGGRLPPTGPKSTTRYGPKPKPLAQKVFHNRLGSNKASQEEL
ncbi:hypothetical protein L211DRAFT_833715 [Terfezia boudieri ATCC MYA-4762]|uniref:Uncharacterized protein n=1 Tax=Terfezia boudieri ATCC MYA-4762 TaxID=1051890 RepID=A0A3N4M116_9PEZI|nr:hypothetical protein L211DRAFT_833715 [Terfezia boudieri ATCC MYA-4762]